MIHFKLRRVRSCTTDTRRWEANHHPFIIALAELKTCWSCCVFFETNAIASAIGSSADDAIERCAQQFDRLSEALRAIDISVYPGTTA